MSKTCWLSLLALAASLSPPSTSLRAADHLDAPALAGRGDMDVNDLYAFQSPVNPNNTVLILTVNPFAGQLSGSQFSSETSYEFLIDNTGDAQPNVRYSTTFSPPAAGVQALSTSREENSVSAPYATGSTETDIAISGGGALRAGLFDDPFFFDLAGFQNGFNFTGDDAFAGADVSAIVLDIPSSELGGPNVGIWARTVASGQQVDRKGRPAINTALIPSSRKDEFNQSAPVNDVANFAADVQASIESLNGGDSSHAAGLTAILLPDVLTLDTSNPAGFLNGRQLADDVIDAELNLLSSGAVTGDGVDANDVPFRNVFPYLAPANIPEPTGVALAAIALHAIGLRGPRRRKRD